MKMLPCINEKKQRLLILWMGFSISLSNNAAPQHFSYPGYGIFLLTGQASMQEFIK
jgi:hypothetical protein